MKTFIGQRRLFIGKSQHLATSASLLQREPLLMQKANIDAMLSIVCMVRPSLWVTDQ